MRACPQCQRTYPDDTDICPRDGAPLRKGNPRGCPVVALGRPQGPALVAAVSDRRSAIGDRRYNRGIYRCD
jgi:predicted amidophosphoribosyltransferase